MDRPPSEETSLKAACEPRLANGMTREEFLKEPFLPNGMTREQILNIPIIGKQYTPATQAHQGVNPTSAKNLPPAAAPPNEQATHQQQETIVKNPQKATSKRKGIKIVREPQTSATSTTSTTSTLADSLQSSLTIQNHANEDNDGDANMDSEDQSKRVKQLFSQPSKDTPKKALEVPQKQASKVPLKASNEGAKKGTKEKRNRILAELRKKHIRLTKTTAMSQIERVNLSVLTSRLIKSCPICHKPLNNSTFAQHRRVHPGVILHVLNRQLLNVITLVCHCCDEEKTFESFNSLYKHYLDEHFSQFQEDLKSNTIVCSRMTKCDICKKEVAMGSYEKHLKEDHVSIFVEHCFVTDEKQRDDDADPADTADINKCMIRGCNQEFSTRSELINHLSACIDNAMQKTMESNNERNSVGEMEESSKNEVEESSNDEVEESSNDEMEESSNDEMEESSDSDIGDIA